jgi:FKBP-type peptidyl-prolyl cis-trans isomerase FklB
MKNGLNLILVAGLFLSGYVSSAQAEDTPAFKDDKEKASYAIGADLGNRVKRAGFEVDVEDVLSGKEARLNDTQIRETIMAYQQEARKKTSDKNKKEAEEFLAANKGKPEIKTQTITLPDGKTAEMQYKVITEGKGDSPKSNDVVTVHYRGTLLNGKEFDSSAKRGQPAEFPVNRVIRGWTEALQMMKVGAKWELYLPPSLAYGDNGMPPNIEPGSALIFEVELLGIKPPAPPPAPAQPLTSDIIRVPSADELKKGAKIEVLKPEDVEKLQKGEKK